MADVMPDRVRARADPHLLAGPRRPARHGQRRLPPRPPHEPQGVRRGDGHPGRRRAAHAGLPPRRRNSARARRRAEVSRASSPRSRGPPAPTGWWAGRSSTSSPRARRCPPRRSTTSTRARPRRSSEAPSASGALLAGARSRSWRRSARTASRIGLAFQIVDDILDVEGSRRRSARRPARTSGSRRRPIRGSTASPRPRARRRAHAESARGARAPRAGGRAPPRPGRLHPEPAGLRSRPCHAAATSALAPARRGAVTD